MISFNQNLKQTKNQICYQICYKYSLKILFLGEYLKNQNVNQTKP